MNRHYYQFFDGKRFFIRWYTKDEADIAIRANGWKLVAVW